MPETLVKAPDGSTITVRHPEGATEAEIIAYAQSNYQAPEAPTEPTGGVGRQLGLTARAIGSGLADAVSPLTNPVRNLLNLIPGMDVPRIEDSASQLMTQAGIPEPQTGIERGVQTAGSLLTSIGAGGGLTNFAARGAGITAAPQIPNAVRPASTPAANTLLKEGIPLDRSQVTGGRFAQLRSAVTNHPFTADKQIKFAGTQQKAFNRAVLRSIGANADEATQGVMADAKRRIGSVFDDIGKAGAQFDDTLQSQVASIVDDALATVPESELAPLLRNIDDLLDGVDYSGAINGDIFIRLRSRLSELARRPGIGTKARDLESALLDALERTHPGQRAALSEAKDQWRNLRIIQSSISKGAERDISPLRLSNQLGSARNQAMSVFGQGGDQGLVRLAQAGRDVLPQALPDSGTIPRGLLRAIATAPLYKAGQQYLLSQPGPASLDPLRSLLIPAAGMPAR